MFEKKRILNSKDKIALNQRLLDNLKEKPKKLDLIIENEPESKEYLLNAIAYLLEEDKVYYNSKGLLCVNK